MIIISWNENYWNFVSELFMTGIGENADRKCSNPISLIQNLLFKSIIYFVLSFIELKFNEIYFYKLMYVSNQF